MTSSPRSARPKSSSKPGPDYRLEQTAHTKGFSRVCGADEAGRGPLAGPVVAAAVILNPSSLTRLQELGLDDSKSISQTRRERILNVLNHCAEIAIRIVEPIEIEHENILWASLGGMADCADTLSADYALIDGNRMPKRLSCSGEAVVKGDACCLSIAAASIVAKVTRDRLMIEADARFPCYGFAQHKGYPTAAHLAALEAQGPCPIHRRSFGPVGRLL